MYVNTNSDMSLLKEPTFSFVGYGIDLISVINLNSQSVVVIVRNGLRHKNKDLSGT